MDRSFSTSSSSSSVSGLSTLEQQRRRALLVKIAHFESRGAILPTDARTLRSQLHDSTSGQWRAVEVRLQQLSRSWNPYQDSHSAPSRVTKERAKRQNFYELLGLANDSNVTAAAVRKQFRKLALLLHPDKKRTSQKKERGKATTTTTAAAAAEEGDEEEDYDVKETLEDVDSTQFARLRLAYETLSDPERRASYDAKLEESLHSQPQQLGEEVKNQVKLEASTDFASLEWMARVKHKMDVMERIAEWAKLLELDATELRFETGEPCVGKSCGKIVSMDRDLECSGSPRRRVYICLLHKYIHACDESCTSTFGDAELDRRVCCMRAYWIIQNWLFDQIYTVTLHQQHLQQIFSASASKDTGEPALKKAKREADYNPFAAIVEEGTIPTCQLVASEIHLGDQFTRFQLEKHEECQSEVCRGNFQFLEDGIYACRRHGTPHICTFEQCDRQELRMSNYVCWVSDNVYGCEREEAGTDVRTRRVIYSDAQGDEIAVEMEVPVMLPLGKATGYLLEGPGELYSSDICSLSLSPPDDKALSKRKLMDPSDLADGYNSGVRVPRTALRKKSKLNHHQEREISPMRKRLHQRLITKMQRAETTAFHIFLKLPSAVAILPKVALELEEAASSSSDDEDSQPNVCRNGRAGSENLLQIFVHSHHTVNYIKYWMEELTEQQLSIWDQQIYWGDTLIGEETNVMVLEEHGLSAGCVLELRLHDDCPLLISTWNGKSAPGAVEYNTVQISKEAEEDLDDLQEEWENVVAAEEHAFEQSRLKRKRKKMERRGALKHTEMLQYDNVESTPRLLGVIHKRALRKSTCNTQNMQLAPTYLVQKKDGNSINRKALVSIEKDVLVKEGQEQIPQAIKALRALSNGAQPVKRVKKEGAEVARM